MPIKMKRSDVVEVMKSVGLYSASALSTPRLQKKVNLLDRVYDEDKIKVKDESILDKIDFILEAIENGEKIILQDDRPDIPAVERKKESTEGKRRRIHGGGAQKKSKYDWDQILNGEINVLEQGTDYDCKSQALSMQIRNVAKRKGIKVRVAVRQGKVVVQAQN